VLPYQQLFALRALRDWPHKKFLEVFIYFMIGAYAKNENTPIIVGLIINRTSIASLYPPKWCISLQLDRTRRGRIGLQ
jgi:hypothetical protein